MKVPLLIIQSVYDLWCIRYILNITCSEGLSFRNCKEEDMLLIEEHRINISNIIENIYHYNNFTQDNI
jgi:hypothetical protein